MVHSRVLLPVRSDAVPHSVSEHRCDHRQLRTCWTHRFQHAMANGYLVQRSAPSFVTVSDNLVSEDYYRVRLRQIGRSGTRWVVCIAPR